MKRFEVESVYVSNVILPADKLNIMRKINLTVSMDLEELQDLHTIGMTPEELAKIFAETMRETFLKINTRSNFAKLDDQSDKTKISFAPTEPKEFGWYKMEI